MSMWWLLVPAWPTVIIVVAMSMRAYERYYKPKGLSHGYQRLLKKNPFLVGMIGASGGQVRAVAI